MNKLTRRSLLTLSALAAGALPLSPMMLKADEHPDRTSRDYQLMSFVENISSFNPNAGTGTLNGEIVLSGRYNGKGTRHEEFHVIAVTTDGSPIIQGTSTITTPQGKMETVFTATIHARSNNFYYVEGFEAITSGTGAYKNAQAAGSFVATQDNTASPPKVVGTFEGRPLVIQSND